MWHNETIDLCDSSDDEPEARVLSSGVRQGSANAPVCLDVDSSSHEEEATNEIVRVPQNQVSIPSDQEVIELDDSSDDDSVQVVESGTRKPAAATMTAPPPDDSDFDSSDDERDLMWHRQGSSIGAVNRTVPMPNLQHQRLHQSQ